MNEKEFLKNVDACLEMLLKNVAHSFGIDFAVLNETLLEVEKRLKSLESKKANKLKPCPFCGKKPKVIKTKEFPKGYRWRVECYRGNTRAYTCSFPMRQEAIEAWNRRAEKE